jgi:tRNA threonylcarbamoyl adenosine modification protein YeaZ
MASIGPGSLQPEDRARTAKGFSYATGKPIVPVPTLDAFARTLPFCSYIICPILDARKNQVYAAFYKWNGSVCNKIMSETAISPADLLNKLSEPAVFMGDGVKSYGKLISDTLQDKAVFAPASRMSPSAATVGEIALEKLKQGLIADPSVWSLYTSADARQKYFGRDNRQENASCRPSSGMCHRKSVLYHPVVFQFIQI